VTPLFVGVAQFLVELGKRDLVVYPAISNPPFPSFTRGTWPSCGAPTSRICTSSSSSLPSLLVYGPPSSSSKIHMWFLAIFAVGIGMPRWCQVGRIQASLVLGAHQLSHRCSGVFPSLWLGVLNAVQGVGLGMILLQTLSRLYACTTFTISQMLGSIIVIVADTLLATRFTPATPPTPILVSSSVPPR